MSWKKNVLSYLIWFVYTVMVGFALIDLGSMVCRRMGMALYWGIALAALYAAVVAGIVALLHRFAVGFSPVAEKNREHLLVLEVLVVLALTAAGIVLRVQGIGGAEQSSVYYETARVAAGQRIPQTVHGAVYFYLQALHVVYGLVGNHFVAGIWFQITIQIVAVLLAFFAVRRLAGAVASLVFYAFCTCSVYMVGSALTLSPDMLYFFVLAFAAFLMTMRCGSRGEESGQGTAAFFMMGVLAAACGYLDIMGMGLLILALGIALGGREDKPVVERKALAIVLCIVGVVAGFAACFFLDAFLSGKGISGIGRAWLMLYQPEGFQLPVAIGVSGSEWESFLLVGLMAFGIFSFWCDRKRERISAYILTACCIALGSCFGILTEEMQGYFFLYLLFAVLAGISLGQCFYAAPAEQPVNALSEPPEKPEEGGIVVVDLDKEEIVPQEASQESAAEDSEEKAAQDKAIQEKPIQETSDGQQEQEPEPVEEKSAESVPEKEMAKATPNQADEDAVLAKEKALKEEFRQEKEQKPVRFLENPLPLPKKHVKRVMDYSVDSKSEDDFDYPVADDDDFDV